MYKLRMYVYLEKSNNKHSPIPVSIGVLSDFGTMFYAEFTDVPYRRFFSRRQQLLDRRSSIFVNLTDGVYGTTVHRVGNNSSIMSSNIYMKDSADKIARSLSDWFLTDLQLSPQMKQDADKFQIIFFGGIEEKKLFQNLPWPSWKLPNEFNFEKHIGSDIFLVEDTITDPVIFNKIDQTVSQYFHDTDEATYEHAEYQTALYQVISYYKYFQEYPKE